MGFSHIRLCQDRGLADFTDVVRSERRFGRKVVQIIELMSNKSKSGKRCFFLGKMLYSTTVSLKFPVISRFAYSNIICQKIRP